jgi:hypothetical protein
MHAGTCNVYSMDGLPFDATPWDGILRVVKDSKTLLVFEKTETVQGIMTQKWVADKGRLSGAPFYSWYDDITIWVAVSSSNTGTIVSTSVTGRDLSGETRSVDSYYVDFTSTLDGSVFEIPIECQDDWMEKNVTSKEGQWSPRSGKSHSFSALYYTRSH